jgi:hypothetical protein
MTATNKSYDFAHTRDHRWSIGRGARLAPFGQIGAMGKVSPLYVVVGATHSPSKTIRAFTPVFAGYAVNALVVVARRAGYGGEAGGHKASPLRTDPFSWLKHTPRPT